MALDHAALLEVLDVLKAGDAGERVRVAAETMYQALIETELSATIGAQPLGTQPVAQQPAQRLPIPHRVHDRG